MIPQQWQLEDKQQINTLVIWLYIAKCTKSSTSTWYDNHHDELEADHYQSKVVEKHLLPLLPFHLENLGLKWMQRDNEQRVYYYVFWGYVWSSLPSFEEIWWTVFSSRPQMSQDQIFLFCHHLELKLFLQEHNKKQKQINHDSRNRELENITNVNNYYFNWIRNRSKILNNLIQYLALYFEFPIQFSNISASTTLRHK